jgi:hypothetical protein
MRIAVLFVVLFLFGNTLCFGSCLVDDCGAAPSQTGTTSPCHHQQPAPKPRLCSHPNASEPSIINPVVPTSLCVPMEWSVSHHGRELHLTGNRLFQILEDPPDLPKPSFRTILRI